MGRRLQATILLLILLEKSPSVNSQMRTLYKGPVTPPADGEEFDLRRWMQSALPRKEDRCSGNKNIERTTPASVTTSPCPVNLTFESRNFLFYPEDGKLNSRLERLEFTLHSYETTFSLRLYDQVLREVYLIGLGNGQVDVSPLTPYTPVIIGSKSPQRIDPTWVTFSGDTIEVGEGEGESSRSIGTKQNVSIAGDIWRISLQSQKFPNYMSIYAPCN